MTTPPASLATYRRRVDAHGDAAGPYHRGMFANATLNRAKACRERFAASISAALEAESPISPDHDAA